MINKYSQKRCWQTKHKILETNKQKIVFIRTGIPEKCCLPGLHTLMT